MTTTWLELIERPAWMTRAACRGMSPGVFFPERGDESAGRAVCVGCPVRAECLAYALNINEQHGTWGGYSPRQRRAIRHGCSTNHRHPPAPTPASITEHGVTA